MELGPPILADMVGTDSGWVGVFSLVLLALGLFLLVYCLFSPEMDVLGAIKETFGRYTAPSGPAGKPIDTTPLAPRLKQLRQEFAAEASSHRPSFKKAQLVEDKREQLSQLAFFKTESQEAPNETTH